MAENRAWKSSLRGKSETPDVFLMESADLSTGNRLSWFCIEIRVSKFQGTLSLLFKEMQLFYSCTFRLLVYFIIMSHILPIVFIGLIFTSFSWMMLIYISSRTWIHLNNRFLSYQQLKKKKTSKDEWMNFKETQTNPHCNQSDLFAIDTLLNILH